VTLTDRTSPRRTLVLRSGDNLAQYPFEIRRNSGPCLPHRFGHAICYHCASPIAFNDMNISITLRLGCKSQQPSATCPLAVASSRHIHLASRPSRGSLTMTLPDGRQLGYAECGPKSGKPIFYIPGILDSRVAVLDSNAIAAKLGIRLIGIDRPGIGLSTYYPKRKIMDFVQDFHHLVNHLKISLYRVYSISGGTPYLLACAKHLP
jgi:hypothetical protein